MPFDEVERPPAFAHQGGVRGGVDASDLQSDVGVGEVQPDEAALGDDALVGVRLALRPLGAEVLLVDPGADFAPLATSRITAKEASRA